tara:strand:- start:151 stop:1407 length:1257 start_codon:yes stop_codon:yes gene_type:complete
MFFIYQILIFITILFSPLILLVRFLKNKEDKKRFIEKFSIIFKKKNKQNLVWIHAASVGEVMSVVPLIDELEKDKKIEKILLTTSTLSSSKIFENLKFKKTFHQFFPIDFFFLTSIFIKHWRPKIAIFIDSEIWPCMFTEIKKNKIPLILLNARITERSFKKWQILKKFSSIIFGKIDMAYPSNFETMNFLKKFKVKKIKKIGNLKFTERKKVKEKKFSKSFLRSINKKLILVASSTHPNEEMIISKTHLKLKKIFQNLLTIIIPRHIHRVQDIAKDIQSLNLKTIIRTSKQKIRPDTDIYLVDTYGETKKFFNISKTTFIGGSLTNHGGQNPIEPARFGLNIIHGPHVRNFRDIFKFFANKKISHKIKNHNELFKVSQKLLTKNNKIKLNLRKIGNSILNETVIEIKNILSHEIKKT